VGRVVASSAFFVGPRHRCCRGFRDRRTASPGRAARETPVGVGPTCACGGWGVRPRGWLGVNVGVLLPLRVAGSSLLGRWGADDVHSVRPHCRGSRGSRVLRASPVLVLLVCRRRTASKCRPSTRPSRGQRTAVTHVRLDRRHAVRFGWLACFCLCSPLRICSNATRWVKCHSV